MKVLQPVYFKFREHHGSSAVDEKLLVTRACFMGAFGACTIAFFHNRRAAPALPRPDVAFGTGSSTWRDRSSLGTLKQRGQNPEEFVT